MNDTKKVDQFGQQRQTLKPKKNPKADVTRNGSIYFAVGLLLMLVVAYSSLNFKTYEKSHIDIGMLDMEEINELEIPLIKQIVTPPPPPIPVAPPVIEIIDDEADIEETVIETTDTDEDDKIAEPEDILVDEIEEEVDVPFVLIKNVPIYPGCEKGNNAAKRKCMSDKISKFVQRKFNSELASELGLSGRQRISVIFKIDKKGSVVDVQSRAPHPRLEKEAARVINLLPQMKPGMHRDKVVTVSYSLPIVFLVQD